MGGGRRVAPRLDRGAATRVLTDALAGVATGEQPSLEWVSRVESLSRACEREGSKRTRRTHVAFVGTAILAKATDPTIDEASLSASSGASGYSARNLAEKVLAPLASQHRVHLGATGREPLNNQPYLAIAKSTGRVTLDALVQTMKAEGDVDAESCALEVCAILERLHLAPTEASDALRAFILVRQRYAAAIDPFAGSIELERLLSAITRVSASYGAGGRVAQAIAAGLIDAAFGSENVETARVNDPDRHLPADIAVRTATSGLEPPRAIEVRDKLVSQADVEAFGRKMVERRVPHALLLAAAQGQGPLTPIARMPTIAVCSSWADFLAHLFFWQRALRLDIVGERIHERLVEIEAPPDAIALWDRHAQPPDPG